MIRVRRYHESGAVDEHVDPTDVSECLGDQGALLWVDVEDPTPDDIACLTEEFGVHHLAAEDLTEPAPRPRLAMFDTHFVLSVRDCIFDGERFSTREVNLVFADGWLLSLRKVGDNGETPMPVDEVVERFERTRKLDGATDEGFLLFVFLDTIVDRFFDVSDAVEERLEAIEDDIFFDPDSAAVTTRAPADRSVTERLYRLRHDLIGYRRVVSPLRDAVNPLLRNEVEFLGDAAILHLRDVYDHVVRAVELSEAHRDLLNGALDAHLSLVSNRMNLVMKRATSWGAILVCATLVAGVYGMNFKEMPELNWVFGYPMALGLMALIAGVLYVMFKKKDWL
ncbi:MAG TPA: magnesium/cobalt transporter CorA [Acidimicrobiia bacterium]|nr:magnesium/cobalt transporter CorA [Acidimicrobiia bacterium]